MRTAWWRAAVATGAVATAGCSGATAFGKPEAQAAEQLNREAEERQPIPGDTATQVPKRGLYVGSDDLARMRLPGGPQTPAAPSGSPWEPRQMTVDLTPEGMPISLEVPEGAAIRLVMGTVQVAHGPRFALLVRGGAFDLEARKRELDNDRELPVYRYLVNRPDALLYETSSSVTLSGVTEFHIAVVRTLSGRSYLCEDVRGPAYTRAEAEAMLDACLSLRSR